MSAARSRAAPYTNPLRAGADTFDGALATPPPVPRPAVGVVDLDVVGARDASGLEAKLGMSNAPMGTTSAAERDQDELTQRLARLRNES